MGDGDEWNPRGTANADDARGSAETGARAEAKAASAARGRHRDRWRTPTVRSVRPSVAATVLRAERSIATGRVRPQLRSSQQTRRLAHCRHRALVSGSGASARGSNVM